MNRRDLFKLGGKIGLVALAAQVPLDWLERAGLTDAWLAEAATLPQNYELNAGTVFAVSDVNALVLNVQTGGDGTATVSNNTDTRYIRPGDTSPSIRFQQTVGGSSDVTWNIDWAINTTLTGINTISIPVYADLVGATNGDVYGSGWNVTCYLATDATYANRWQYQPVSVLPNYMSSGWNLPTILFFNPSATTEISTLGSTFTRFRLQLRAKLGTTGALYFGTVRANQQQRTKVCFGYEDVDDSQYTIAWPYLQARGIRGSQHVVSDFVQNSAGVLTVAQLNEMYAAGWSFHNHSHSHAQLDTLSTAQIRADLTTCKNYMADKGWTYGQSTFVYPRGPYSSTFYDTMEAQVFPSLGITHARITRSNITYVRDGFEKPLRLNGIGTGAGATLATLKGYIDDAIKYGGGSVLFYTHDIDASSPGPNGVTTAIHHGLVDYAYRLWQSNVIDVCCYQELIDGLTFLRRKRAA